MIILLQARRTLCCFSALNGTLFLAKNMFLLNSHVLIEHLLDLNDQKHQQHIYIYGCAVIICSTWFDRIKLNVNPDQRVQTRTRCESSFTHILILSHTDWATVGFLSCASAVCVKRLCQCLSPSGCLELSASSA